MFERFTERARQLVVLAHDEALALGHDYIGAEHLLLGLLREEEGLAARTLEELRVDLDGARRAVEETVGRGHETPQGQIPFTDDGQRTLELSLREASARESTEIRTEHLLLGLLQIEGSAAHRVLSTLGADPGGIRSAFLRGLGDEDGPPVERR